MRASLKSESGNGLLLDLHAGFVHITLDRPSVLNALSWPMMEDLRTILRQEPPLRILVSGAGGKAFCAGGDIKAQVSAVKSGDPEAPRAYFRAEYALNAELFHYKGDYISYLNGIVMGGGFGVSAHGTYCVATEATQFAMPEVKIGFFPDVGIAYHLARVPHQLGTYLALTGNTINAADMLFCGLAQYYVPLAHFDALKAALQSGDVADTLSLFHELPKAVPTLQGHVSVIEHCFALGNVEAILDALDADGGVFAKQAAADIRARSPLSVKVALAHVRQAAHDTFDQVIARDLRLAYKFLEGHDFAEGVRAAVIDKDRNPQWKPADLRTVTDETVALYLNLT